MKMNKIFSSLLLIAGTILVIGCSDHAETTPHQSDISVSDGRLVFRDENIFGKAISDIQNGNLTVVNDRLDGLQYSSFGSAHPGNPENEEVFTIKVLQIVANENREYQVGTKIYRLEGNTLKVFSETRKLENEIAEVVQTISREGRSIAGRDMEIMNMWYTEDLIPIIEDVASQRDQVRFRLKQVNAFALRLYYVEIETHPDFTPTPLVVEAIRFWGSTCINCTGLGGGPLDYYNVSSASFPLGYITSADWKYWGGVGLSASFKVKRYGWPLPETPYGIILTGY
jgi:hypothetical protein